MLDIVVQALHVHHEPARVSSPRWRACPPSGLLVIYSRCLSVVFLMRKVIRAGVTGVASGESSQGALRPQGFGGHLCFCSLAGEECDPLSPGRAQASSRGRQPMGRQHRSPVMVSYPTWPSWRGSEGRWQVAPGERIQEAPSPAAQLLRRSAERHTAGRRPSMSAE